VCYNFFKNILLVLPQFWYGALSTFSAQSLYDAFIYQLFNILYASMPIIIYAVFDEEHKPDILVQNNNNYYIQGLQSNGDEYLIACRLAVQHEGVLVVGHQRHLAGSSDLLLCILYQRK
jgi:magnesium-transporting ATPase (P-type)